MLESFRATQEWLHILSWRFISLVILKNRTYIPRPSLGNIRTRCTFNDNFRFEFATNEATDVCIGMSMLFLLGGFLKSHRYHFSGISCACVSSWDCCWECSCSAIVDASGAAHSVLFASSVRPVYGVAAVWVSLKLANLCLCFPTRAPVVSQQVQSASVRVNSDQVTNQSRRCKFSVEKKTKKKLWTALCPYIEQPRESCTETQKRF